MEAGGNRAGPQGREEKQYNGKMLIKYHQQVGKEMKEMRRPSISSHSLQDFLIGHQSHKNTLDPWALKS